MLNSNVWTSREKQHEIGPLVVALFDVDKFKGVDYRNKPYAEKLEAITEALKSLKNTMTFTMPAIALETDKQKALLEAIEKGQHPTTREGVVFWNLNSAGPPIKVKFRPDYDVYVRGFFEGEGKFKDQAIGGFYYSWSPTGAVQGKVGTGLTDFLREDMFRFPQKYIGRVAKVQAHEVYPDKENPEQPGALRAPAFIDWHLEKGMQG